MKDDKKSKVKEDPSKTPMFKQIEDTGVDMEALRNRGNAAAQEAAGKTLNERGHVHPKDL